MFDFSKIPGITPPDFSKVDELAKQLETNPALAVAAGIAAMHIGAKLFNKIALTPEQRKRRRRIKAAKKVTRYSVKLWKDGRKRYHRRRRFVFL